VAVSVLEPVAATAVGGAGAAIAGAIETAVAADRLGYARCWFTEHHGAAHLASPTPAVLIAMAAARTRGIRLGAGGVMLPNHAPLAVAEAYALLEAAHPGRIDLGIGRAPGGDPVVTSLLRRAAGASEPGRFARDLDELLSILGDERGDGLDSLDALDTAAPLGRAPLGFGPACSPLGSLAGARPSPWLLGSSTAGAELAGAFGLPFAFANHFDVGTDPADAAAAYRDAFAPTAELPEPRLLVTVAAIAADSLDEARRLALPARAVAYETRFGRPQPVRSVEAAERFAATAHDGDAFSRIRGAQLLGTGEAVARGIRELAERTGADEIMLTAVTPEPRALQRTLELVAEALGVAPRVPD